MSAYILAHFYLAMWNSTRRCCRGGRRVAPRGMVTSYVGPNGVRPWCERRAPLHRLGRGEPSPRCSGVMPRAVIGPNVFDLEVDVAEAAGEDFEDGERDLRPLGDQLTETFAVDLQHLRRLQSLD